MLLEKFPALQQLDGKEKAQLATELWERAMEDVIDLPAELLAAMEERIAYNEAHPSEVFTTEQVAKRLAGLKQRIAARKAHG